MYGKISTTWLFYVFLSLILTSVTFSTPIEKPENESKTMYQTLVLKCPHVEKTKLHENFKDIFDNKCTNWTAINDTKTIFSNGITNARCLVLYESLLSFCKAFGEKLSTSKDFMPTNATLSNKSIYEICNISSSLNNTEHNISDILNPMNCAIMCSEATTNQEVLVHNICRLSYFFGTFHVEKFLSHFNNLITNNITSNNLDLLKQQVSVEKSIISNQRSDEVPHPAQNPQQGTPDKQESVDHAKPKQPDNEPLQIQGAVAAGPAPPINLGNPTLKKETDTQPKPSDSNLQDKSGKPPKHPELQDANLDSIKKFDTKSDTEPLAKSKPEEAHNEQKVPEADLKPLGSPIEKPKVNAEEHISDEDQDNAIDEEEQDNFHGDKDEEVDENGQQKMIPDNEPAPPIKVEKPTTVEKEAISSYNIPEDDMDGDSYFFSYFTVLMCLVVVAYVGYHNRQKILALVLEGKRGKRSGRQGRRPNSANYHKLGSNLEEAISSSCKKDTSNIIY